MSEALAVKEVGTGKIVQADSSLLGVMERFASNPNLDADKIEKLFNIFITGQRQMRVMNDEQAFAHGMAEFKKNPPSIVKNRTAKLAGTAKTSGREYSYEYSYADLDAYCKEAMPLLALQGITWSFPFSEDEKTGKITVSCVLRYGIYSNIPTTLSGMPEGGNNPLQAKGVTVAYLERYTFCGATGLTAAMPDSDGNKAGVPDLDKYFDAIKTAPDVDALKKVYLAALEAVKKEGRKDYELPLAEAKNNRYKELNNAYDY
jgi:hypothetical protein